MPLNFTSPAEVTQFIKEHDIKWVDARFTNVSAIEQHLSVPAAFDESAVVNGVGFGGSSISGCLSVENSDMKLLPHLGTAFVAPFCQSKPPIFSFIHDPYVVEVFSRKRHCISSAEFSTSYPQC